MKQVTAFNWFQLDRNNLYNILYELKDKVVNQQLTPGQVHTKFVNQIKQYLPIKISKKFDTKVDPGKVWIGGFYYSDLDESFKNCIEIEFNYYSKTRHIKLSRAMFSRTCLSFADTVLHEIIHMRQHRRRNYKTTPNFPSTASRTKKREEQAYLGCRDEIDAYAFNSACELHSMFDGRKTKIINYINQNHKGRYSKNCFQMYMRAFEYDHSHPIIKHLKKKIFSYLPQAEVGKPYRNSEWINH